jgi:CheY-like chemotaxis protein
VRPFTIVVVDDDERNRLVIRYLFEPPAYRVVEAPDGVTGLELIRAEQPDCVLLDLAVPGLEGLEVLEHLRNDSRVREIPVVVLTASSERSGAIERALRAGAVDYLTKPISPGRLAARVRGAIQRRRLVLEMQQLRGMFTSMLVHDRRSLTIIIGYLQLLEDSAESLQPKHRRYLGSIRESCTRMIALVGDIPRPLQPRGGQAEPRARARRPRGDRRRDPRAAAAGGRTALGRGRARSGGADAHGDGGSAPARAGSDEPGRQRDDVHPARRPDRRHRRAGRRRGAGGGQRFRARRPGR